MATTTAAPASPGTRIRPSIAAALVAWLAYTVVVNAIQLRSGVPYTEWFTTAAHAWRIGVLSLAAGSAVLVAFLAVARWRHVWTDPVRLETRRVMSASIAAWWIAIVVRLAGTRWSDVPFDLLLAIVASGILVGFAEETLFRGIVLRCLREGGRGEATAAIWTAACFGLFHLPNVFMGTGVIGLVQVVLAGLSGALLYVFRRRYGTIWPAMAAHGAWDISTFVTIGYPAPWLLLVTIPMQLVVVVLGITVLVDLHRRDGRTIAIPPGA